MPLQKSARNGIVGQVQYQEVYTTNKNPMQFADVWSEVCLYYLTPRSLGLLECASKSLYRANQSDERVWQRQAVLAWNGFYLNRQWESKDYCFRTASDKFLTEKKCLREFPHDYPEDAYARIHLNPFEWHTWDQIMCSMEVTGDGYKTIGYATECAKMVTKYELDEDWNLEHLFGERTWVEMLKEEIFEEPDEECFSCTSGDEDSGSCDGKSGDNDSD